MEFYFTRFWCHGIYCFIFVFCCLFSDLLLSCALIRSSLINLQTIQVSKEAKLMNLHFLNVIVESFQGVLDRFTQIKPKVIFSVEAVRYNNKIHNHLEKLTQVVKSKFAFN